MLPSYSQSRMYSLFFIFYLIIGLFLLLKLLLAIIYSNYQSKTNEGIESFMEERSLFVEKMFFSRDIGNKEYLTKDEAKALFVDIHTLVLN